MGLPATSEAVQQPLSALSTKSLELLDSLRTDYSNPNRINAQRVWKDLHRWREREISSARDHDLEKECLRILSLDTVAARAQIHPSPLFHVLAILKDHLQDIHDDSTANKGGSSPSKVANSSQKASRHHTRRPSAIPWKMINSIMDQIYDMSDLYRDLVFKPLYPGAEKYTAELSESFTRAIFPHARLIVVHNFNAANPVSQTRAAVAISSYLERLLALQSPTRKSHKSIHVRRSKSDSKGPHARPVLKKKSNSETTNATALPTFDDPWSSSGSDGYEEIYFCAFPDCEHPPTLFDGRNSWEKHMQSSHPVSPCWVCESPCHSKELKKFFSEVELQTHMWDMHRGTYSVSSLCYLTQWCKREPSQSRECVLCLQPLFAKGLTESAQDAIVLNHYAQHFHTLASQCQDALHGLSAALEGHNAAWTPSVPTSHDRSSSQSGYDVRTASLSKTTEGTPPPQEALEAANKRLACPFYKWGPRKYPHCESVALTSIPLLKHHLREHHWSRPYCRRCFKQFDHKKDRDQHVRDSSCAMGDRRVMGLGLYDDIDKEILERTIQIPVSPRMTEEEQWNMIFAILFPQCPLPRSPYSWQSSLNGYPAASNSTHPLHRSMSESNVPRPSLSGEADLLNGCVSESDGSDPRATTLELAPVSYLQHGYSQPTDPSLCVLRS
ncbi:hypothetical protein VB005_01891 [Metarhizium brunneum]